MATLFSDMKTEIEGSAKWVAASWTPPTVEDGNRKSTSKYPHWIYYERITEVPDGATSDGSLTERITRFILHVHEANETNKDKALGILMDIINNKQNLVNRDWKLHGPLDYDHLQRREIVRIPGFEQAYLETGSWPY